MNVLIIGSGGREHALAWKVAQSTLVEKIWVAPGNAGTALENKVNNISIHSNINTLIDFVRKNKIDLTIVGSELPLAGGIVDQFHQEDLAIFGPTQAASQLETSKSFCKAFLSRHNIPTANFVAFKNQNDALAYLSSQSHQSFPIVIKASGLAAGKGVFIAQSLQEAQDSVISIMEKKQFGRAGEEIVIEKFLSGEELSFIAMVDGKHILPLAGAQDHKRLLNKDRGPNTGGMGAYSPIPRLLSGTLQKKIMAEIMYPTISGLKAEGITYVGFLYAGLMISPDNEPKVLEFNVRLGDPETQPLIMRLHSDLIELILAALSGKLNQVNNIMWDPRAALAVVMTAGGYPMIYNRGDIIEGLNHPLTSDVKIFHAGTKNNNDVIVTSGGRVLSVTALGINLHDAQRKAYQVVNQISWPHCHYRDDIGYRAIY